MGGRPDRLLLGRLIHFEVSDGLGGDGGVAVSDPAPPPPDLGPGAGGDPAPPPAFDPAPLQAQLEAQSYQLQQLTQYLEQQARTVQQAPQAQQGPQLPEWDPYDPQVVAAYQAQGLQSALSPLVDVVNQLQQSAQQRAQQEAAATGRQVFDGLYQQFQAQLPADTPAYVKDKLDSELVLRLAAPYLVEGYDGQATIQHVGQTLAGHFRGIGEAAVEAYKQSLAAASGTPAEPGIGQAGGHIEPGDQRDGESPYRAHLRRVLDAANPSTPL